MGILEDNFCEALSNWKNEHFQGSQADLGKLFGVTQAQINRVLNKTRAGDETWRRMVAKKIGIPYDKMIGMASQSVRMDISAVSESDITIARHKKIIDSFQDKKLALEINEELVELEKLNKGQLKDILEIIKDRRFRLEQESEKKRPAVNGE